MIKNSTAHEPLAETLIASARGGCQQSIGKLAERYRRYLLHVANDSLSPALRAKVAPSDLVQETLLVVHAKFAGFAGNSEQELLTWLRHILYFRALQVARRFCGTAARDVRIEVPMDEAVDKRDVTATVDPAATPFTGLLAKEQITRLNEALAELDAGARQIILLRSLHRKSFADIGEMLGCSTEAARKRWVRAIAQLRVPLGDHE